MTPTVEAQLPEIIALCRHHRVRRLSLFGSAVGDRFDPETSDLDFLVEFEPLTPTDHADRYFELLHGLEDLFARRVDLLERAPIGESEVTLYEAA